jgi:replication-associated recombination protein RarA
MLFDNFEEKFTPKTIDDIVFSSDQTKQYVEDLISGLRTFPITEGRCGILLYGVSGSGKSSLSKLLPNTIERARGGDSANEHYKRIEAGDNGLKTLTHINSAAQLMPPSHYHYFILDEVDRRNDDAMKILKSTMNYPSTVFIMSTNHYHKIDSGVIDRCHCIQFNAAPSEKWLPLARKILAEAKIGGITDAHLINIISQCKGSARNVVDAMQELAIAVYRARTPA